MERKLKVSTIYKKACKVQKITGSYDIEVRLPESIYKEELSGFYNYIETPSIKVHLIKTERKYATISDSPERIWWLNGNIKEDNYIKTE